jgi:hypothetical protein
MAVSGAELRFDSTAKNIYLLKKDRNQLNLCLAGAWHLGEFADAVS